MTRLLSLAAFAIGALVILWMGVAVAAGHLLASVVMLLIALAYFTGGAELLRYQQATGAPHEALNQREIQGMNVFRSFVARCAECHTPPAFTNQQIAGVFQ